MSQCPCGSSSQLEQCCLPFIKGEQQPQTAEQLMRSRYSAYTLVEVDYLINTVCADKKHEHTAEAIKQWAEASEWLALEIIECQGGGADDSEGTVEFMATYKEDGTPRHHHELAQFRKDDGQWKFFDGLPAKPRQIKRDEPKVGRNDPCSCGSGKKFKKCCGR